MRPRLILLCLVFLVATEAAIVISPSGQIRLNGMSAADSPPQVDWENYSRTLDHYQHIPLSFERNDDPTTLKPRFLSRAAGYRVLLTATEAHLQWSTEEPGVPASKQTARSHSPRRRNGMDLRLWDLDSEVESSSASSLNFKDPRKKHSQPTVTGHQIAVRMQLVGANPKASANGLDPQSGKVNYLVGSDRRQWKVGMPTYARVQFHDVYPGISLVYYGNSQRLEYDFIVAPGANPQSIALRFDGIERLEIDARGDLVLHTRSGAIRQQKPQIYQGSLGKRKEVPGYYAFKDSHTVGFEVGEYDARKPLVIDPVLGTATYLGGHGGDRAYAVALDAAGNIYLSGETRSVDFPTANPLQPTYGGDRSDVFVTKLNPGGTAILYSTYLGGGGGDAGYGIAVDSTGSAYVTGRTYSSDFPTTAGTFQRTIAGGDESFISKFNPDGNALVYSSYLGGNGGDDAAAIALDSSSNAYVTGGTDSSNFPTTAGAFQRTKGAGQSEDAFVTKINPQGSALVYSTYLGSSEPEGGFAIAVEIGGSAYVTGTTLSPGFPTTPGAFQSSYSGGGGDAFVTKLNPQGSALTYSTFLGGSGGDVGLSMALDASGNAFLTGVTISSNFPTSKPVLATQAGNNDAFAAKLNNSGSSLLYSTYLGGSGEDEGYGIAVDPLGNAYVTGTTTSTNFPLNNPLQPVLNGNRDAFVTKLAPDGSTWIYSTYLGGSDLDYGAAVAVDTSGAAYIAGRTNSSDFPTSPSAARSLYSGTLSRSLGNTLQAFVVKIFEGTSLFLPVVVSTSGVNNSFFNSELVLTNHSSTNTTLTFSYMAAFGGGGGTATDLLAGGEQRIIPDAISYLRSLGMPIPDSGNRGGTLAIRSSSSGVAASARTTTAVATGRAGLAYPGIATATALRGPVYLCGLRQNATDRSNVAVQNVGAAGDGDIVLRLTVISGETGAPISKDLPEITLPPGGFAQINSILASNGLSLTNGYVRVERIGGSAPYYAYAVINDQVNSDGSFVPPMSVDVMFNVTTLTLPVLVETSAFESDLVITNLSNFARSVQFEFVADDNPVADSTARFELNLAARTQQIFPEVIQYLRSMGVIGLGPRGGSYAGALFAKAPGGFEGLFIGARTSTAGGGGRYGLFYTGVPSPAASTTSAWIFGLQQNAETRSNLALINTGEADANPDTFDIELFDGSTGRRVSTIEGVSLKAKGWTQIVTILAQYAPGITQGYARILRTAGNNPFVAYAVVNDGGQPGERSGDGAFVISSQ